MNSAIRPRRSVLYMPGANARALDKARSLDADVLILDLEDAVAVSEKVATRPVVAAAFSAPRAGKLYVRVNALTTDWCHGDLVAVVQKGLDGIILPKVEHGHELRTADWLITNLERERGLPVGGIDLIPIIETALAISNLARICRSGTRVKCLAFGAGDFDNAIGRCGQRRRRHEIGDIVGGDRLQVAGRQMGCPADRSRLSDAA